MKKILLCIIAALSVILTAEAETITDVLSSETLVGMESNQSFAYTAPSGGQYRMILRTASGFGDFVYLSLRKSGSNKNGFFIDRCPGAIKSVTAENLQKNRVLAVYGSNEPLDDIANLYTIEGTLVGELVNADKEEDKTVTLTIPEGTDYKYYWLRVPAESASGVNPGSSTTVDRFILEYEPLSTPLCDPIVVTQAGGEELSNNAVTYYEPTELTISCATDGSVISYDYDGVSRTLDSNPGSITLDHSGTLVLTASKDGYESTERTLSVTMQLKPAVLTIGGAVYEKDYLRAYESTPVSIAAAHDGAAISWEYNGRQGTSPTVEVREDGELKVTVSREGWTPAVRTLEVRGLEPLTSIQAVWDAYPVYGHGQEVIDEEPLTVLFDATVVYVANVVPMSSDSDKQPDGQIYITDGTHFSRIYLKDKSSELKPGDVIAAGWKAHFRSQGGWKDFLPDGELTVKSHDGVVPAPVAVGNEEALQALDPGTPVMVSKVTLTTATKPDVYTGDINYIAAQDCGVNLVNAFGLASVEPGVYDVYGIVDFYGYKRTNAPAVGPTDGDYASRNWRVAPTRWEVWLPTAPRPRFELATGAEVDSGEPIVITCQDAEATIMYRFDEEEYAVYNPEAKPVMPARDVTVSACAVREGNHDSAVRSVSLKYSGKAGIGAISADAAGEARYYDLQGRPVAKPATGLYIKVENGKAGKVAL